MLQKIVNGIALASGVVSLTVVGTVGYLYVNKDAIIEDVKSKVMESVLPAGLGSVGVGGIGGALGGLSPTSPDAPDKGGESTSLPSLRPDMPVNPF
tara:strand:- start:26 stop:313 length:288 start_codon:yes stop_codon:yes gene_type:complete